MRSRYATPSWGAEHPYQHRSRQLLLAIMLVCAALAPAVGQPKGKPTPPPAADAAPKGEAAPKKDGKPKTFDFTALDLNGRMRSPQLLYFLERANEELERASLEKRSFIPHMVRSLDEEAL